MLKEECFLIGTIFKLHGYKGEVKLYNESNSHINLAEISYFLIEQDNILIPFSVIKARNAKKNIILVKFDDINSEEQAKKMLKKRVYIAEEFTKSIKKNINKYDLEGITILDSKLGVLGKISHIDSQTSQKLIYVDNKGKKFCFPMHKKFIININNKKRIMKVNIPEELINLN